MVSGSVMRSACAGAAARRKSGSALWAISLEIGIPGISQTSYPR